jgi:hypothetical protein
MALLQVLSAEKVDGSRAIPKSRDICKMFCRALVMANQHPDEGLGSASRSRAEE